MYVTKEQIKERTGYEILGTTLGLAQMMVEAWSGRDEAEVEDAGDRAILAKAVTFQAIYIKDSPETVEQAGIRTIASNGSTISFDLDNMAPHMSPWAVRVCKTLSWRGTRSVKVGKMLSAGRANWEQEWLTR